MFQKIKEFLSNIIRSVQSLERKTVRALVSAVLAIAAGALTLSYEFCTSPLPPPDNPKTFVLLDNSGWSEAERQRYYHLSQGSQVMPYDWFIALEHDISQEPFSDPNYMSRFRFISDEKSPSNPDALPIGFAKDDPDPVTGVVNVGLSCATCHTAQMTYKGKTIRIDGGSGMVHFDNFLTELLKSLTITVGDASKFDRFARKVLKDGFNQSTAQKLRDDVQQYLFEKGKEKAEEVASDLRRGEKATPGGYGRIDALGAGGNRLYRRLGDKNLRTLNSPVKILPVWYTHQYNWVQTNGSIREPMARNIIEALAVNASLVFPGNKDKNYEDRYISSVRLNNMFEMETMIARLRAPDWPEDVLGPINQESAKRGEALYQKHCASCHAPQKENQPEAGDAVSVKNNKTFFVARLFPMNVLKTDPVDAGNFADRRLDASAINMGKDIPGATIIGMVLQGIIDRRYKELNLPLDQQDLWNGYRSNLLRACKAYPARPLYGIWAAAPYLHNGSVPNLYQLLLPADKRINRYFTGNTEFDPVNVGYAVVTEEFPGSFEFKTSITGNSNAGHQYGTSMSDPERYDLIEFLKALKWVDPDKDFELVAPQPSCPP
jgi:RoxA-like, cytochrome c-like/Cytochrome C oxidase, cbb3-type, subunit III